MDAATPMVETIAEACDRHLSALVSADRLSHKTQALHRTQIRKLVRVAGATPADALRLHHLAGVVISHHFARTLKALYKWAADEDVQLLPRNQFAKLTPPPTGRRERVLSQAEWVRLLWATPSRYRRLLWLAAETTMRPGEVRALTFRQIDFNARTICLTKFKAKRMRRDGRRVRYVPLTQDAGLVLDRLRRRRPSDGLVFTNHRGLPITGDALGRMMRRARARAGLEPVEGGEPVVCYTLRHTSATNRIRGGMPINVVSETMGHTNTTMTQRYQHLGPADLVAELDRLRPR
jgi:integrase